MNQPFTQKHLRLRTSIVLVLSLHSVAGWCGDQRSIKNLPVVVSASVPLYPPVALLTHFQGLVRLRVSTDGEYVSKVEVLEGQASLAQAATENVKSWRFKMHPRTTFETMFRYKLLPISVCEAGNASVSLRLPINVEISTHGLKVCDGPE